jgi:hypothetical protein
MNQVHVPRQQAQCEPLFQDLGVLLFLKEWLALNTNHRTSQASTHKRYHDD